MSTTSISDALRERLIDAAGDTGRPTALRLAALLWKECPVEALERAARSPATIERLASARHPQTPEDSLPMLVREGPEEDRLFWLGVVVHVASVADGPGWKQLFDVSVVLAELARADALVDTPTHALARDLLDASSPETSRARLAQLSQHPLPLVTALLLARGDLDEAAEVGMLLGEPHPIIAEKLALRTRSPLVLSTLGQKLLAKRERRERSEWRLVEKEIAANPYTPLDIVEELVAQAEFEAWWDLAESPTLPPSLQAKIVERGRARLGPWRPDGSHGPVVLDVELEALAKNAFATAETLERIAESSLARVRAVVAVHPRAPEVVVARLAGDPDAKVRAAIAGRPDLSPALIEKLADDVDRKVVCAVAANPRAPEDRRLAWEALAASDAALRDGLAANPTTTPALLARWLEDTDASRGAAALRPLYGLRVNLAANPATPPERLSITARTAADFFEAAPAARNPSCPIEALEKIAAADTSSMQRCLFENPACPTPILERAMAGLLGDLYEAGIFRAARNVLWARAFRPDDPQSSPARR